LNIAHVLFGFEMQIKDRDAYFYLQIYLNCADYGYVVMFYDYLSVHFLLRWLHGWKTTVVISMVSEGFPRRK